MIARKSKPLFIQKQKNEKQMSTKRLKAYVEEYTSEGMASNYSIVYLLAIDILQRKDQFQPKAQATSLTISNTSARLNLAIFLEWKVSFGCLSVYYFPTMKYTSIHLPL